MSVLHGGNFSSSKATEENSLVVKKSSKAGLTQRSTHLSIKENPTVHSVKRTSTIQGTPVLTHRHALNDLSNTARKAQHGGNSKPSLHKGVSKLTKKEKDISCERKTVEKFKMADESSASTILEDFPDIEYMPAKCSEETSTSFKTPEYFKGLISSALRPNPFKYIGEIVSIKDLGKLNIESVDRPNTFNNEMAGMFCQPDVGPIDDLFIDLPDIDDLHI